MQLLPVWLQFLLAVVPGVSALFAAAGLLLNVMQSRKTNKQARATSGGLAEGVYRRQRYTGSVLRN